LQASLRRSLRLARVRYGASALRAESSNPAFSPFATSHW